MCHHARPSLRLSGRTAPRGSGATTTASRRTPRRRRHRPSRCRGLQSSIIAWLGAGGSAESRETSGRMQGVAAGAGARGWRRRSVVSQLAPLAFTDTSRPRSDLLDISACGHQNLPPAPPGREGPTMGTGAEWPPIRAMLEEEARAHLGSAMKGPRDKSGEKKESR